jgi:hypothetical protein
VKPTKEEMLDALRRYGSAKYAEGEADTYPYGIPKKTEEAERAEREIKRLIDALFDKK